MLNKLAIDTTKLKQTFYYIIINSIETTNKVEKKEYEITNLKRQDEKK